MGIFLKARLELQPIYTDIRGNITKYSTCWSGTLVEAYLCYYIELWEQRIKNIHGHTERDQAQITRSKPTTYIQYCTRYATMSDTPMITFPKQHRHLPGNISNKYTSTVNKYKQRRHPAMVMRGKYRRKQYKRPDLVNVGGSGHPAILKHNTDKI